MITFLKTCSDVSFSKVKQDNLLTRNGQDFCGVLKKLFNPVYSCLWSFYLSRVFSVNFFLEIIFFTCRFFFNSFFISSTFFTSSHELRQCFPNLLETGQGDIYRISSLQKRQGISIPQINKRPSHLWMTMLINPLSICEGFFLGTFRTNLQELFDFLRTKSILISYVTFIVHYQ